jgi:uncharacterized repeat protein (TIGR03803 family)
MCAIPIALAGPCGGTGAPGIVPDIREEMAMIVTGKLRCPQRALRSWTNPIRPIALEFVLCKRCILSLATFGALSAIGSAASATPTLTTLATFNSSNGAGVFGVVADGAGNLYGTTYQGGANDQGTVFEVAAGTRALSTLVNFNNSNGEYPSARLVLDTTGNLYGTTSGGGASGAGTVFEVAAGTRTLSSLVTFNRSNGTAPNADLLLDGTGNLYGTTSYDGGANASGTVFKVAAGTHSFSTLATFNYINGEGPWAGVIADAAGNLYGTTRGGGPNNAGTVFEVAAGTHALSTLVTFVITNGVGPVGDLLADAAGNLYGTTEGGGANLDGTVFEVAAGTHALSTLVTFTQSNGRFPRAGLIADAAGNLYGTTFEGGANDDGTVFKVAAGTHALSTLVTFNFTNGKNPQSGLIADASGNIYGTTGYGGASSVGTVFELTDTGFVTAAPEPAAASLIGLACLGLLVRRRRSWSLS